MIIIKNDKLYIQRIDISYMEDAKIPISETLKYI